MRAVSDSATGVGARLDGAPNVWSGSESRARSSADVLRTQSTVRRAQPHLGTIVEMSVAGAPLSDMEAAVEAAFAAVADVHRLMSFHDGDSDVGRLNRTASMQPVAVHAWTFRVLETAAEVHRHSGGAFDIAVAPALQDLGLLPRWSEDRRSTGDAMVTADAVELLENRCVRFRHPSVRIDLGGIAKGFAVDCAVDVLRRHGMPCGLVNAGGDLAAFGPHPRAIHIRDPRSPDRLMCRVEVMNEAMASTGGRFDPFRSDAAGQSAVIAPATGAPARAVHGASVRASSAMIADALTKVVMIAGEHAARTLEHFRASAMFVSADGDVRATADWQGDHHHAN
jgi:thiamine biosynthesis lipoprotein